jgi:hypothetical protein
MALIKENDLTEGMSGRFGRKIIFRVVKGVTVAARRSTAERVVTDKQAAHQKRFQRAAQYAKAKMLDPIAKEEYKKMAGDQPFATAFNAALRDYMVLPQILDIDVSGFNGAIGSAIPISVSDNLKTIQIQVAIQLANGTVQESGDASLKPGDLEWKYITKLALPVLAGSKIIVTAIDRPGNKSVEEKLLA